LFFKSIQNSKIILNKKGGEGFVRELVELLINLKDLEINDLLWSYKETSFLPHGSENDENSKFHRVYLTCKEENPNDSKVIFSIDGLLIKNINSWKRCVYIFNEQNLKVVDQFNLYKNGIDLSKHSYKSFEQDTYGKWINSN